MENAKVSSAVIVGGGYIGLEMAENLVQRGVKTTIVEKLDQVMSPLDYEMIYANGCPNSIRENSIYPSVQQVSDLT